MEGEEEREQRCIEREMEGEEEGVKGNRKRDGRKEERE